MRREKDIWIVCSIYVRINLKKDCFGAGGKMIQNSIFWLLDRSSDQQFQKMFESMAPQWIMVYINFSVGFLLEEKWSNNVIFRQVTSRNVILSYLNQT